ncbi:MAG: LCP family protein [Clostridiales bacterium]|nr:LCP family protein [Clostridiales bacterium]
MEDIYISGYKNRKFDINYVGGNDMPPDNNAPKRKKKKKKKSVFRKILSFFLVIAVIFGTAYFFILNMMMKINYNETGHQRNQYIDESELMSGIGVKNILLVGVDARAGEDVSRSDTMIILTLDSVHRKIKLTSFLRDSWVKIPDSGYAKLNASCVYGGAQLVMDTIETNFKIKIDNYMLVNFEVFTSIVDSLGGITVEVTEKEARYMRDVVHLTNVHSGESVPLNGNEALWYCRIRKLDNDFMRTSRQRKVISAILDKVKRAGVANLTPMLNEVFPQVETDMSPVTLTNFAMSSAVLYLGFKVESQQIPADGTWADANKNGQSVLSVDLEKNRQVIYDFIYGGGTGDEG